MATSLTKRLRGLVGGILASYPGAWLEWRAGTNLTC